MLLVVQYVFEPGHIVDMAWILPYNIRMDIFVIETSDADNIKPELLEEFKRKEISDTRKLKEHCLSYLMADLILKEFYAVKDREIVFEGRKPILKSGKKFFGISHSGEYIVLGFSDSNCGIDAEKVKTRNFKKIAKRMGFNCGTLEEFYGEWTKYESEYKLGKTAQILKIFRFGDYIISAVSENPAETFEIYIQSGEIIPEG